MPIWVPEYLSKNQTESQDDKTLYIDLPKNEQISFLQVEVSAQGSATPRTTTTLIDDISKYEVLLEGQKAAYSAEPEIAAYIHFLAAGGKLPSMSFNYTPNARELHEFIIPFGRYPFDPEYVLDTGHYSDQQLQIPYNIDNARWTSGTFRHNVVMWRPLERVSPKGFIRTRLVKKETSSGSAETLYHDLPTKYPLRFVGVRVEDADQNIATDITSIKVDINSGRLILFDLNINELRDADKLRFPWVSHYEVVAALSDGTTVKGHMDSPWAKSIVSSGVRALMFKIAAAAGEQFSLNIYEQDGTAVSDSHAIVTHLRGSNPHKCLCLIDGREEPFPIQNYDEGSIEYELAAYTTTLHTFVQEVVPGVLT